MKHAYTSRALRLAILAALTFSAGTTTALAQIVEIREKEASSCLDGRTGDNSDPRSTCPDEKGIGWTELRVISTMLIRPGQRARMTMQLRSFEACKRSYAVRFGGATHTGWNFSYQNAPCQWDEDRTDLPAPAGTFPNGELLGKQLCAVWRVRNPTAKELRVSWLTAHLSSHMDGNARKHMVIRNNIDRVVEAGIAETQRIETCLNPEPVNYSFIHRRWPSVNGLHIQAVPPFPDSIQAPNGNIYLANNWSYWYLASGHSNTTPLYGQETAVVAFYTDTMRDWALQSGEASGRYFVHLERAWIKDVATGAVVQELN